MSDYRITKEQRAYLDTLVCQRISDDQVNKAFIDKFFNYRSLSIPGALKKGWNQDKTDKVAYYIIREPDKDGEPLFFFSLRCGEVALPFDLQKLRTTLENSEALVQAARGEDAPDWAKAVIEKRKVDGKLPYKKYREFLDRFSLNDWKWNRYSDEIRREGDHIVRTKQTLAGVELVHFCAHSPASDKWETLDMNSRSMGKVMFWQFVVPVIQQIRSLVGCEYLYLFAADQRKNGKLVKYYKDMGFEVREDLCVNKPEYDFCCFFMCQKVTALRNRQNEFFRNYNAPEETEKQ